MHGPPLRPVPGLPSILAAVCLLLGAPACTDTPSPRATDPSFSAADVRPAHAYECAAPDGSSFHVSAAPDGDQWTVFLPGRFAPQSRVAHQVPAASGVKFEGPDLLLWTKGPEARVDINGRSFRSCTRVVSPPPAGSTLAPRFRALGQEPGWSLTLFPDRLWFVGAYGRRPLAFPLPEPTGDLAANRTTYRAETPAHTLRVVLRDTSCTDTMSGASFPYTVSLTLNDTTYAGCGTPLS